MVKKESHPNAMQVIQPIDGSLKQVKRGNQKQIVVYHSVSATETKDQVERALLLDVVVGESAPIFQLLTSEDETLLVRRDTLLVLNLALHIVDCVGAFNFQCNCLPGEGLNKNLHTTTETKDKVKSGFFLDVVVREGATILKLLSGENETLLVGRNAFLVLDL